MPRAAHASNLYPAFSVPSNLHLLHLLLLTSDPQVFVPFVSDVRVGNFGEEENEERERRDTR